MSVPRPVVARGAIAPKRPRDRGFVHADTAHDLALVVPERLLLLPKPQGTLTDQKTVGGLLGV
jgi:hypothetical protein